MRIYLAIALLLAVSASALRTDYHLSEEEFESLYGGWSNDPELEKQKAEKLAQAEAEINAQNLAFEHGESSFFEDLNENSNLPDELFNKEKFGAIDPSVGEVRGKGAFDRALNDPQRVDDYSQAFFREMEINRQTLPASFDARSLGVISSVKNQGACGSCTAFSSTSAIETCIANNNNGKGTADLAEETLIDCGFDNKTAKGCNGAVPDSYLLAVTNPSNLKGLLPHEFNDMYKAAPTLTCKNVAPFNWGAKVTNRVYTYSCTESQLKQMIYSNRAVVTVINASGPGFSNLAGGIYDKQCDASQSYDHAVTAVGWETAADGSTLFIVKNSWGTGWGEGGYFRIKFNQCKFGVFCGVPQCTTTNVFDVTPPAPTAATCDVTARWGALTSAANSYYQISINGGVASFKCTNGICTPLTPQPNACIYICGAYSC